jgi:hypothetical protein
MKHASMQVIQSTLGETLESHASSEILKKEKLTERMNHGPPCHQSTGGTVIEDSWKADRVLIHY